MLACMPNMKIKFLTDSKLSDDLSKETKERQVAASFMALGSRRPLAASLAYTP